MIEAGNTPYRRWKFLRVTFDFFVELMSNTNPIHVRVVKDALPKDSKVVNVDRDPMSNTLVVTIESESFEPVQFGERMPELNAPSMERTDTIEAALDTLLDADPGRWMWSTSNVAKWERIVQKAGIYSRIEGL